MDAAHRAARGHRHVGLHDVGAVAEVLGEAVAAERLEEDAALVGELARRDDVGARDRQGLDLHQRPDLPRARQRVDVGAVAGLGQLVAEPAKVLVVDPAGAPGDLLDAADLVALPGLDDVHELAGVHQALEGAGVEPGGAAGEHGHREVAALEVGVVDGGDLELAAGAGREVAGDLDDVVVVEVQARHRVVRARVLGLLLDREHACRRRRTRRRRRPWARLTWWAKMCPPRTSVSSRRARAEAGAVEDVVAEHEGDGVVADEVGADDERLRQAVGAGLHGVRDLDAPLPAVAEQALELVGVLGRGDDEHLADAGHHQRRQRVVDHRLVVDRHELLAMPRVMGCSRVPEPPARMMPFMVRRA